MARYCCLLYICATLLSGAAAAAAAAAGSVVADVNAKTGAYTVSVDGIPWFDSGPTYYTVDHKIRSTADGSLRLASATTGTGSDALGAFSSTTMVWDGGAFITSIRQYSTSVVFEQEFPNAISGTSRNATTPYAERDFVSTSFPSLLPAARKAGKEEQAPELGYLAFA
eukprot:gene26335-34495_t